MNKGSKDKYEKRGHEIEYTRLSDENDRTYPLFLDPIGTIFGGGLVGLIRWIQKRFFGVDRPQTGNETLFGEMVKIRRVKDDGEYSVMYEGEIWTLVCDEELSVGDSVRITGEWGLKLTGRKAGD